jgi:Zn-dependent peptidase ImmA (M78 family)
MPKVNHNILRWARETAGLSLEEATTRLKIGDTRGEVAVNRLLALETGAKEPTRPMILKMAKQYRRPLLTFYMSIPPRKGDRGQDFRTLPVGYSAADNALVDALLRDIKARQGIVRATLLDEEEAEPLSFVGSAKISDGVPALVTSIQKKLGIDREDFRGKSSPHNAFNLLRERTELTGVFVLLISNLGSHHTTIELDYFRGFTLADDIAPFIIINDQDAHSAWSFTLIHELVHLWLGQTAISGARSESKIERFCDDVAGEFLLPNDEIDKFGIDNTADFETILTQISRYADSRNVSSSMVAYKLFRRGVIERDMWARLSGAFRKLWLANRSRQRMERREKNEKGPNYFVVRQHRVGKALISFVDRMMTSGAITTSKAGKVLGVKGQNVQTLVDMGRSL